MIDTISTHHNKMKTIALLGICGILSIASTVVGIDDNPPGVLLALFAAIALVLAFVHPWRITKKFLFLILVSLLGFVFFIFLNIISDSIVQNPATSRMLRNLIQSPVNDALSLILTMIFSATFIVGVIGSVAVFFHNRRRKS